MKTIKDTYNQGTWTMINRSGSCAGGGGGQLTPIPATTYKPKTGVLVLTNHSSPEVQ